MGFFNRKKPVTTVDYSNYYDKKTNSDIEIISQTTTKKTLFGRESDIVISMSSNKREKKPWWKRNK